MTAPHAAHIVARFLEALSVPALVGAMSVGAGCGGGGGSSTGGGGSPTAPTPGGTGSTATVTIGSDVAPRDIRIESGDSIRFVNSSSRVRQIMSDPHPTHGSCPPIDRGGALQPGGNVVVGPFTLAGTCHYHDHNDPDNADMRGQIRIAVDTPGPGPNYLRP